jgi:HD-like signal output (HDOD) protein
MLNLDQVLRAVRAHPCVPAPTAAVSRVLAATKNPDADVQQVAQIISRDAGLTIQLLREVNSSLYACANPTSSIPTACVRLGMKRVRATVINQHVVSGLGKACPQGYDTKQYFQSALATSVAAHDLATQLMPAAADDAGTAGLLCDIGIGMMAHAIPNEYGLVLKESAGGGLHQLDALERRRIGVTHSQVGAAILLDWKLDQRLIDAVSAHHGSGVAGKSTPVASDAKASESDRLFAGIVRAAATLAGIAIGGSEMELVESLFTQAADLAPNADALVDRLLGELVEHIQKTAAAMNVQVGEIAQMEQNFASLAREKLTA